MVIHPHENGPTRIMSYGIKEDRNVEAETQADGAQMSRQHCHCRGGL
jgi:hypothetical protein